MMNSGKYLLRAMIWLGAITKKNLKIIRMDVIVRIILMRSRKREYEYNTNRYSNWNSINAIIKKRM